MVMTLTTRSTSDIDNEMEGSMTDDEFRDETAIRLFSAAFNRAMVSKQGQLASLSLDCLIGADMFSAARRRIAEEREATGVKNIRLDRCGGPMVSAVGPDGITYLDPFSLRAAKEKAAQDVPKVIVAEVSIAEMASKRKGREFL